MKKTFILGKAEGKNKYYKIYNNKYQMSDGILDYGLNVYINKQGKLVKSRKFYIENNTNYLFKTKREGLKVLKKHYKISKIIDRGREDHCCYYLYPRDKYILEIPEKPKFHIDCVFLTETFKFVKKVKRFIKKNLKRIGYQYQTNRIYGLGKI